MKDFSDSKDSIMPLTNSSGCFWKWCGKCKCRYTQKVGCYTRTHFTTEHVARAPVAASNTTTPASSPESNHTPLLTNPDPIVIGPPAVTFHEPLIATDDDPDEINFTGMWCTPINDAAAACPSISSNATIERERSISYHDLIQATVHSLSIVQVDFISAYQAASVISDPFSLAPLLPFFDFFAQQSPIPLHFLDSLSSVASHLSLNGRPFGMSTSEFDLLASDTFALVLLRPSESSRKSVIFNTGSSLSITFDKTEFCGPITIPEGNLRLGGKLISIHLHM
jgi:hypothetical protein